MAAQARGVDFGRRPFVIQARAVLRRSMSGATYEASYSIYPSFDACRLQRGASTASPSMPYAVDAPPMRTEGVIPFGWQPRKDRKKMEKPCRGQQENMAEPIEGVTGQDDFIINKALAITEAQGAEPPAEFGDHRVAIALVIAIKELKSQPSEQEDMKAILLARFPEFVSAMRNFYCCSF